MSTNYYAHILPTKERKKKLHDAIDSNNFDEIKKLVNDLYESIEVSMERENITGGVVHLGKCSGGWKFHWNPNIWLIRQGHVEDTPSGRGWVEDAPIPKYIYPLTKQGVHDFIFREDVEVYDEYGEKQDKGEFWQMALTHGQEDGWDAASYEEWEMKQDRNYRVFPHYTELAKYLEEQGYKFTSNSCSDFYADGLLFTTYTEFS